MLDEVKPVRYSNKFLIFHFESLRCTSSSCYQCSVKRDWCGFEHCSSFPAKWISAPAAVVPAIVFTRRFSFPAEPYWLCRANCFKVYLQYAEIFPLRSCHNIRLPSKMCLFRLAVCSWIKHALVATQKAAGSLSVMSCLSLWWDSGTLFRHFLSFSDFHNVFSSFYTTSLINISYLILRPSVLTAVFVFQILLRSQTQDGPHLNSVCLVQMSTHSLFLFFCFSTHFLVPKMSAELTRARLSPAQTLRQWSQFTRRCVRAWGGLWWWPVGCWEPTHRACCGSSGCCQTGCSMPEPSTPKEMRRSTPFAAWIETAGGSTPVMSSTRRERGNAPSRLQVGRAGC